MKCSFVEIYNEQLYDLLDPKGQRVYLKVNLSHGVFVDNLTEKIITSTKDALKVKLMMLGYEMIMLQQ